jgi:RNA polymerase sigma-70 factor (ECF subfamily)
MEINYDELTLSGEELYSCFLDGQKNAFEKIVELYENDLSLFIDSIVHDHHESKHLCIETFAQLALTAGQFRRNSSLKTYLFTIGRNLSMRYLKMRAKEQHLSYEEAIEGLNPNSMTPDRFMEQAENKQYLLSAMQTLKEEYRVVLELLYFEDLSYMEAGKVMKKSIEQVSNLAYRAKAALKKKLEEAGFTYD